MKKAQILGAVLSVMLAGAVPTVASATENKNEIMDAMTKVQVAIQTAQEADQEKFVRYLRGLLLDAQAAYDDWDNQDAEELDELIAAMNEGAQGVELMFGRHGAGLSTAKTERIGGGATHSPNVLDVEFKMQQAIAKPNLTKKMNLIADANVQASSDEVAKPTVPNTSAGKRAAETSAEVLTGLDMIATASIGVMILTTGMTMKKNGAKNAED